MLLAGQQVLEAASIGRFIPRPLTGWPVALSQCGFYTVYVDAWEGDLLLAYCRQRISPYSLCPTLQTQLAVPHPQSQLESDAKLLLCAPLSGAPLNPGGGCCVTPCIDEHGGSGESKETLSPQ